MSSEDQAILAGDQQQGGSNAGEEEEVVSKYFARIENVNSNVNTVDLAMETVNSHVNLVDLATETANSNVDIVDPIVEKVNSDLDAVDLATETVISNVDSMGLTAEKLNSNGDTVDPAAETVISNVDTVDPAAETVISNVDTVDPAAETVISNVDTIDPAAETVNSNVDTIHPAAETVNSNVDTIHPPAETVISNVDTIDPAAETVNSNVDTIDPAAETVISNVDTIDSAAETVISNVDTIDPAAETVNSNVDTIDPAAETVISNVDTVDPAAETKDAPVHVDHMENICEEEGHKEMDTELNDRLPKTSENSELENMIIQSTSNEVLQTPETIDMEENTNCDIDQNLDTAEATLNTESAEISEAEQIHYTNDDFRSPESDMERDMEEEMNISENVEDDDLSASNVNSEQWTEVTSRNKKKRERRDDKIKENVENDDISASSMNSEQLTVFGQNKKKRERKDDKIKDERHKLVKRFSDRDTENYRNGYPGKEDDDDLNDNIRFYMGEIPSSPDGDLIDDIHKNWKGNYKLLERHHGYIQWLFPIRESGMNWQAQPLQLHEAEAIKADPKARKRVLESYKLMLDFYGMELVDEVTGKLERSKNWKSRFENLKWSSHNYLRITRILKCLGELGYEHLKKGFIQFVLKEALEHHTLEQTLNSCHDYWIGTIKDDQDREELYEYIDQTGYKHIGVGAPDPVLENCSGYSGTLWACTHFCMRLMFWFAYIPMSVFWWLFAMIFGTFGKRKQC